MLYKRCVAFAASAAFVFAFASGVQADGKRYKGFEKPSGINDWSGLYLGGHAGYAWGEWDGRMETTAGDPPNNDAGFRPTNHRALDGEGWLGGGQVGFNIQRGKWVGGLEADASWSGVDGQDTYETWISSGGDWVEPPEAGHSWSKKVENELESFGTLRGRLGLLASDTLLIYGTGGLAWGETSSNLTVTMIDNEEDGTIAGSDVTAHGSADESHVGWTIGGGMEWKLSPRWTFKTEYLYADLGDADYRQNGHETGDGGVFDTDSFPADLTVHTVRVGLNFKLGSLFHDRAPDKPLK